MSDWRHSREIGSGIPEMPYVKLLTEKFYVGVRVFQDLGKVGPGPRSGVQFVLFSLATYAGISPVKVKLFYGGILTSFMRSEEYNRKVIVEWCAAAEKWGRVAIEAGTEEEEDGN